MSITDLFNSQTEPIPEIRHDLEITLYQQNGDSYLIFQDMCGYVTPGFGLHRQTESLLSQLNGQKSIQDLIPYLDSNNSQDELLEFIQLLDKNQLLNSTHFKNYKNQIEQQYEQSTIHHAITAGSSYPDDPQELRQYLDAAFSQTRDHQIPPSQNIKALYAPHIDTRVGLESYAKAFALLKRLKPKRVVIIATSHYSGLYPDIYQNKPFILVDKDFELPLKTIERDKRAIDHLMEQQTESPIGLTKHDRAHRMEHSIEIHLLFLSYLWDHDFKIIPFLVGGLDELFYKKDGHRGKQLNNFSDLLRKQFGQNENTFFLISGDLAHFGKKFGDQQAAATMFDEVKSFDSRFLDYASNNQLEEMLTLMKQNLDPYRICGFPPLYTFLKSMPNLNGQKLSYDLWDEQERESAVTFGSILYTDN